MKKTKVNSMIEVTLIEVIFGFIWYYMYHAFIINHIILFGDLSISDLNSNILISFFKMGPNYSNILFIFIYHYFGPYLPISWDYFLFFIPFLTPLGFYYLLQTMSFKSYTRIIATIFYSLNPLTILFGISGLEYTGIFLFFPLILSFMIKYHKYNNKQDLINSSILIALLFIFLGINYLKFIIFIVAGIIFLDVFFSGKAKFIRKIYDYTIWLLLIIFISIPVIISLIYSLNIFLHSASNSVSVTSGLISITKYEFSNSNFEVNLYALPYVTNQLTHLKYENTWYGALYLFLILFSLVSIFKYKGKYKDIYYVLFFVLVFLILFQYGVFNSSIVFLYKFPIVNIYNYPLFFYISQMLIYVMFFAISYDSLIEYSSNINFKKTSHGFKKILPPIIAITFVIIIIVSSLPVIQFENETNPSSAKTAEIPNYMLNLTQDLKPYSNSRVMILPDNTSSLNYLYMGISYYDVYGFPYGYQNFISKFPNLTEYSLIGKAFQNNQTSKISYLLESQDINAIVVLNTLSHKPIKFDGTQINGGGALFDNILNQSIMYTPITWNKDYAIYTFNASASVNITKNAYFPNTNEIKYFPAVLKNNLTIVTSALSYEEYPINIVVPRKNNSITYNQYIKINRTSLKAINENFSNIMFYYHNNTPIPAWIDNINNGTAGMYLKINNEVNQTIYLRIFPKSVNKMSYNGYLGEAPQLSGTGTNVLPKYIKYSSVAVGVFGYGYDGNIYTMNFTFNPSLFSNVENSNLSNIAFYTYNGKLLSASMHGSPENISTSATVTISFPYGVNYFRMDSTNENSYNIFYIGFAPKYYNLNELHSHIIYNMSSSNTNINIGYLPYEVKDFGEYNKYDNGKMVFPYYNNYLNSFGLLFADAWTFSIPVNGYGYLVGLSTYSPLSYLNHFLSNLSQNEKAISYSYLIAGRTASPLYISSNKDSSLMGVLNPIDVKIINQTMQQHSTDIGFGTNNSNIDVYYNYNNTKSYSYKTIYSTRIKGFNNYGIYYNGTGLQFEINRNNVANYNYSNSSSLNLMMSTVGNGIMNTLYTLFENEPVDNKMPIINIGKPEIFQAYFANKIISNPAYVNSTVEFTGFSLNDMSNSIEWEINNKYIQGQTIDYKFTNTGYYNITLFDGNYKYNITEEILPQPNKLALKILNYTGTGDHLIGTKYKSNNTLYIWNVNGRQIQDNSSNLTYNFKYPGSYSIKVFIFNGYGNYSQSFIVNIKNQNKITLKNFALAVYNIILPIILILYLLNKRFRYFVNSNIRIISHKITKISK